MSMTNKNERLLGTARQQAVMALCDHSAYRPVATQRLNRRVSALRDILAAARDGLAVPAAQDHLLHYLLEVQTHYDVDSNEAPHFAAELLVEEWLGERTARIEDTWPSCVDLVSFLATLVPWCQDAASPELFTSTRLLHLADLAPGGLDVCRRRSPAVLRAALAQEHQVSSRLLGHVNVQESGILDDRYTALHAGPGARALYALNELLCGYADGTQRAAASTALFRFFEQTESLSEKRRREKVIEELNPLFRPPVLIAPDFETTVNRLAAMSKSELEDPYRQKLADAFWSGLPSSDTCFKAFGTLQRELYAKLVREMGVLSHDLDPRVNFHRLSRLLKIDAENMTGLHKFDFIAEIVDLSKVPTPTDGRTVPRYRAAVEVDAGVVLELLRDISYEDGHELHLPAPGAVPSGFKTLVRERTGREYAVLFEQGPTYGFVCDKSGSDPEMYFRANVLAPLSKSFAEILSNRGYPGLKSKNGVAQRPDFTLHLAGTEVPTVVLCEMQGAQHFTESFIGKMDGKLARESDVHKYDQIRALCEQGENLTLVAIHHRMLAATSPVRLQSSEFEKLLFVAHETKAWWMFVRPKGYQDMNALPTGCTPTKLAAKNLPPALAHLDVFVLSR